MLDIPLRRWMAAVVVALLGTAVSWVAGRHDFYAHYETFLFLLGYRVGPWLGIVAVDLLTHRDAAARFYQRSHRFGLGFPVWLVAVAASVPFMNQSGSGGSVHFVGAFARTHPQFGDITYFVGFLVAAALYPLGRRLVGGQPARPDGGSR